MNDKILTKILSIIERFENKSFGTKEFHSSIESLINLITEANFEELKERLLKFESDLEYIDFMVDEAKRRNSYSSKISELKEYLKSDGEFPL